MDTIKTGEVEYDQVEYIDEQYIGKYVLYHPTGATMVVRETPTACINWLAGNTGISAAFIIDDIERGELRLDLIVDWYHGEEPDHGEEPEYYDADQRN